jgi:hypothetical protein
MSPLLFEWRYFDDVPSRYDVAKGSISFGAAYLRFYSAWFVTFLLLLLSLATTKLLHIHLNFFAADNGLKWNDPSHRKYNMFFALLFKMSWYAITKKVGVFTVTSLNSKTRTSTGNKKIDASRNRLFRVAIMSCACLLMNTAATVSMSVVLEDWSVSSDQWLTCTVVETSFTRNWANYGFHVGDRYFLLFGSWPKDTYWLLFWLLLLHLWYQPSSVWNGWCQVRGSSRP